MQEILSPCQSLDSLSSSRQPTPRKLNPLTNEKPVYTTFTNASLSSRGSGEKHSKASSHLLKAKRYASGFGYRIISDNVNNLEVPKENSEAAESRADIASSEEYCKFFSSQVENHESGREGFGSDVGDKKALEITDAEMEYKKLQSSIDSAVLSKGKESEDTRAQTNNESYISGSHTSARSITSQFSNQSKEMDRSYHSNHSVASGQSGTYQTRESDLYDTTQSEQDLDTGRSVSLLSSTPRRYRGKKYKQEPIQTIINPPEVPRLGIPSDVNETTGRVSSLNSSAVEEYLTADEKAQQHPDARALEGRINTSHDRAKERKLDNDDTRAERSQQNFLGSDEAIVNSALETSLPPIEHVVSPKALKLQNEDDIQEKKWSQENKAESERSYKEEKSFTDEITEAKEQEDCLNSSVAYQESEVVIDCKEGGSQAKNVCRRKRANENEGTEAERGEDVMKNMELHRGEVPTIGKTQTKVKPERGDDTPRTMAAKGRLMKSAKRRGLSNYYTMGEDERGLEKEYFEPVSENEREEYVPSAEQEKGSELNTPASSRPSSACSASSDGTMQSGSVKKKLKQRVPPVNDNCQEQDKAGSNRPLSAASKSFDGRGDDSNSVKNQSNQKSKSEDKEPDGPDKLEELQKEKLSNSVRSQASYGEDARNYKMHVSSGSRGSITTKERIGTGKGYSIEGEMLARGLDENSDRKSHTLAQAKSETERESIQSALAVEESASKEKAPSENQPVSAEVSNEAVVEKDALGASREDNQVKGDNCSTGAFKLAEQKEISPKNEDIKNEIQNEILENLDVKNEGNLITKNNTSSERLEKDKEQAVSSEGNEIILEKEKENKLPTESVHQELPSEEKAFIEGDSVENEIIKEAASASASLLISDGETVIDFRPLSASTAISVSTEHVSDVKGDHKRMSLPKPPKIAEVTETESNMGSGRIAKESNVPHPAERRQSRSRENKMHIVNIADVKLESYENIKEHPAMKRRFSDYLSSKGPHENDFHCDRNLSLPPMLLDQENAVTAPIAPSLSVKETEGMKNVDNSSYPSMLKTDTQKESSLQEITNSEAKQEARETQNVTEDKNLPEREMKPEGTAKAFNSETAEIGNQIKTFASDDEKEEKKFSPEQQRLHEKLGSKQDQAISSEQLQLQEKTVLDQYTKNEKRIDQIQSQERNTSEHAPIHQEKTIDQRNTPEQALFQQEKRIDQVPSQELNTSQQVQSDQEKIIDQSAPEEIKEVEKLPSDQENMNDKIPSQEEKMSQQILSNEEKIDNKIPSLEVKMSQQVPSDQDKVIDQTSSEQAPSYHQNMKIPQQVPSDQDKIYDPLPSQEVNVFQQIHSDQLKEIGHDPSQGDRLPPPAPSDQDKINDQITTQEVKLSQQILSDQEDIIEPIPTQEVKMSQQIPSEQDKIIDQVPFQKVIVSQEVLLDQEKTTDQIPTQEVKVLQQVKSDEEIINKVPSEEVKLSKQVRSNEEKINDQIQVEELRESEKVPSYQEKRIDKTLEEEAKVSEQLPSDQERVIDKVSALEAKVIAQVPSDEEGKIINQALRGEVKASQQALADPEKITDAVSSEMKVSESVAPDQEKIFDKNQLDEAMVSNLTPLIEDQINNQSQPMEEKVSEQVLPDKEKGIDSCPQEEKEVMEQTCSDQGKTDEAPIGESEVLAEAASKKEIRVNQAQPVKANVSDCAEVDQDKKIDQVPSKDMKVLGSSLSDQENRTIQTPIEEKVTDQALSGQENMINQTPQVEERVLKENSIDKDKIPLVDKVKEVQEPMLDEKKVIVQTSLEQEIETKKSLPEEENVMKLHSLGQEKGIDFLTEQKDTIETPPLKLEIGVQSPIESQVVIEQPLQEQDKSKELLSEQNDPIEKPLDQEKCLESSSKQKEVIERPVHEQKKGIESPSEQREVKDQHPHELEKNIESSREQKEMIEQTSHEQEKSNELPSGQLEMAEQPPHEHEKRNGPFSAQQETVEQSPHEQNKSNESPTDQQETAEQLPHEQNESNESPSEQQKKAEQLSHEQEKSNESPFEQQEKTEPPHHEQGKSNQSPSEQQEMAEQPPHEQEKSNESPSEQQDKVEQPSHELEKLTEQISCEQEKCVESSLDKKKLTDQLHHDQEKVTQQIPNELEEGMQSSLDQKK